MSRDRILVIRSALLVAVTLLLIYSGSPFAPNPAFAATITVQSNEDDDPPQNTGACSLREAIINANDDAETHTDCVAGSGEDLIIFESDVDVILLDGPLPNITDEEGLTIDGGGGVTVNGNNMYLPFFVDEGAAMTLEDLVVRDGNGAGSAGGIRSNGILVLNTVQVLSNTTTFSGGGVSTGPASSVTVNDSLISGNIALAENGGGIFNSGAMTINGTDITGNSADTNHGGGITNTGTLTLNDSGVDGNAAMDNGGGIYNFLNGSILLNNTSVGGNNMATNGGGIANESAGAVVTVDNSSVDNNNAENGGGIWNRQGSLMIINGSSVSGNAANVLPARIPAGGPTYHGGGIYSDLSGSVTVTESTVGSNSAVNEGGGILSNDGATLAVSRSTFVGNSAAAGAGVRSNLGTADISNTTVSGNVAGFGGGLYNGTDNTTTLINVSITNNAASGDGAGLYNSGEDAGDFVMINTIIADQQAGPDCGGAGSFVSQGNNLDSDDTCTLDQPSDIPNGNANLGPLASNGGLTETRALIPGSDAIDAGDDADCAAAPVNGVDQRESPRPQGPQCDIGAFELAQPTPTPTQTPTPTPSPTPTPTTTPTATPSPTPTDGPQADALWADDDCNLAVAATDALKKLQDIASIPYNVEPGCPTLGDFVGVQPAGFGQLIWGDTDCDGDYDAVDALQILRHIAGLPPNQSQPCPDVGEPVLVN